MTDRLAVPKRQDSNGRACADHGGNATGGSSGSSGSSGKPCVNIGQSGCSSLNAPSGCCTDGDHPKVVCNGNNDGKGTAQCCVNSGDACTKASDCCGYAGNPQLFACNDGKCGFKE